MESQPWNLHKMACVSSLNVHDALKYSIGEKGRIKEQALKNKLMTFKFGPRRQMLLRKRSNRKGMGGKLTYGGKNFNAPEDPDDDESLEQDGIEDISFGNKDAATRTPSPTETLHLVLDTESLSDVSNDNVDLLWQRTEIPGFVSEVLENEAFPVSDGSRSLLSFRLVDTAK